MGEDIGKIHILYRHKVLKVVVMNMFQRTARMKKWYNTESEELEDIPFPLLEKHMDHGRDEEAADLHDMFKHEVNMENEWEEMGEVERRQEPGVTWHIQEMEKEDPISNMTADDI